MPRFRKKQEEVEAVQWDGSVDHAREIEAWSDGAVALVVGDFFANVLRFDTVQGQPRNAYSGHWIVRGHEFEDTYSSLSPQEFEATYEPVDRSEQECGCPKAAQGEHLSDCVHTDLLEQPASEQVIEERHHFRRVAVNESNRLFALQETIDAELNSPAGARFDRIRQIVAESRIEPTELPPDQEEGKFSVSLSREAMLGFLGHGHPHSAPHPAKDPVEEES